MPLTGMQKAVIKGVISYGIDEIIEYPEESKALTALKLIVQEEDLSLADQTTLMSWPVGEQGNLFDNVVIVREILAIPNLQTQLNLIRNDREANGHYPQVTGEEVKEYIRETIRNHIEKLEAKVVPPAPIPSMSPQIAKASLASAKARLDNFNRILLTNLQDEEKLRYAQLAAVYATISAAIAIAYHKVIVELGNNTLDEGAVNKGVLRERRFDSLGGTGTNTLSYSDASNGIRLNLASNTANGGLFGNDTFTGFINVISSSSTDSIIGYGSANSISAGVGADIITEEIYKTLDEDIEHNSKDRVEATLSKVTDQEMLGEPLYEAIRSDHKEKFEEILPKVTDQEILRRALNDALAKDREEMVKAILPKVTDQEILNLALDNALIRDREEMIKAILPKITDQTILETPLYKAIERNSTEMFEAILPKITDEKILGEALDMALAGDSKGMGDKITARITELRSQEQTNMLNTPSQLLKKGNEGLKSYDFLRIPGGADAMEIRAATTPLAIDNPTGKSVNIENAANPLGTIALAATFVGATGFLKKLVTSGGKQSKSSFTQKAQKTPKPIESNSRDYISQQDMDNYAKNHPLQEEPSFTKAILSDKKFKSNLKSYAESINKIEFVGEKEESTKSKKPVNKGNRTR